MITSALRNRCVLNRLQEVGLCKKLLWPPYLHLNEDDFEVQTTSGSADTYSECDTRAFITCYSDTIVCEQYYVSVRRSIHSSITGKFFDQLIVRSRKMLLETSYDLLMQGGKKYSHVPANEFLIASYLNERNLTALRVGYSQPEICIAREILDYYETASVVATRAIEKSIHFYF